MTEDAKEALYEESVQTSYRRAGESVCLINEVSKATVKNKLHELEFPPDPKVYTEKKRVRYLYIDVDGGVWIKSRKSRIAGIISALVEYPINNYLGSMTSYLYDSAENGRNLLIKEIRSVTKEEFQESVDMILGYAREEQTIKKINDSARFIM